MTAAFPGRLPARIEATVSGRRYEAHIANAKGHELNPLSDADVEAKFHSLARDVISPEHAGTIVERLWAFDAEPSVTAWAESLRIEVPA